MARHNFGNIMQTNSLTVLYCQTFFFEEDICIQIFQILLHTYYKCRRKYVIAVEC
jgi:hypothetical protein